jgi:hypothetical protein
VSEKHRRVLFREVLIDVEISLALKQVEKGSRMRKINGKHVQGWKTWRTALLTYRDSHPESSPLRTAQHIDARPSEAIWKERWVSSEKGFKPGRY